MPRIAKNLLAGFVALAYLYASLTFRMSEIRRAQPDLYPDFSAFLMPHPILLAYGLAPLLIALAIYQLYQFTMAGRDRLTGAFTPHSLEALRACGLFLTAGGIIYLGFETLICRAVGADPLPFNPGLGLPFLIFGFGLALISRNGGKLAADAQKMRSDLDQIV